MRFVIRLVTPFQGKQLNPVLEPAQAKHLQTLLETLAKCPTTQQFAGWQIWPVKGSNNNLLYRVTSHQADIVVKFTIRDARDRAGREYQALLALQQAGLNIAPQPILLDRTSYPQPVVVQTWLDGPVTAATPATDAEWHQLLRHYAAVHSVTPDKVKVRLPWGALNANSPRAGKRLIRRQMARIPAKARPAALQSLIHQVEAISFPNWPNTSITLCRVDANTLNFVRRPDLWASVDWENSGWGDPVFEIAELMAHPQYASVPTVRWDWVIETYCALRKDATAASRIRVYYLLMLVWWVARLARMLYEVPLGQDKRLVERSADWQADIETKYQHYSQLAMDSLPSSGCHYI